MESYVMLLWGSCRHEDDEKRERCFSVPFSFQCERVYTEYVKVGFEGLHEKFDDWLLQHGAADWQIEEFVDPEEVPSRSCQPLDVIEINE